MAEIRAAATALQIETCQIRNGRWPGTLSDLDPKPLFDPFDGKELNYKRTDAGCVVYSIGMNLRDDGGECDNAGTDDIRFRLFNPDKRNVKPANKQAPK